jgi:hypothetical protein
MLATSAIVIPIIVPVSRYTLNFLSTRSRLVLVTGARIKKRAGERAEARPPAEYYLVT